MERNMVLDEIKTVRIIYKYSWMIHGLGHILDPYVCIDYSTDGKSQVVDVVSVYVSILPHPQDTSPPHVSYNTLVYNPMD